MGDPAIKVSIYEDNEKLRDLLVMLLGNTTGFQVVGAFFSCKNIVADLMANTPDVIIMDIDMPECNGVEGVKKVKEYHVGIKVLMHTVFDDDERLFACLSNGADGYLLKRDSSVYLIPYIKEVYIGGGPMSPGIARRVLQTFHLPVRKVADKFHITPREKQILEFLAKGYSYKMIGIEFSISIETVRKHLKNIYHKLHVQCGPEAVAKAIKENIIENL
jgi:DNA-binding NarL/FixJ family response regulator